MSTRRGRFVIKSVVFLFALVPACWLIYAALTNGLGANPIQTLTQETGVWTLRFVAATLAITPLRRLTGWNSLIKFRRMIGLFAFFYGTVHFFTWSWLDQFFDWNGMIKDVVKRPFITVGFTAFVLMIPLALTSTTGWIRRLGGKRWNRLHQLIYITAILGVIHYYWLVKADTQRPVRYGVIVGVLLLVRVIHMLRQKPVPVRTGQEAAGSRQPVTGTQ
jgi:methionine sulfoxide reductase heme-binding subunit